MNCPSNQPTNIVDQRRIKQPAVTVYQTLPCALVLVCEGQLGLNDLFTVPSRILKVETLPVPAQRLELISLAIVYHRRVNSGTIPSVRVKRGSYIQQPMVAFQPLCTLHKFAARLRTFVTGSRAIQLAQLIALDQMPSGV